jgi:hypothetical protein
MKKYDSFYKKKEKYSQLINNMLLQKTKTIYNTSRNRENNLNTFYKNALSRSDKNFAMKTDSNYFLSEIRNINSNLKYKLFSKKYENIKKAKSINKYEEMKDFSNVIKHLEKWDKEHCYINKDKGNFSLLYNNLITYYRDNNLINEEKNIQLIDNMLKVKPTFRQFLYNNYINQNKLLKELIMRSPTKIIDSNEIKYKDNNKHKSNDLNNKNIINKNKIEDIFTNLLNKKNEDKKNNDFYPHKIMKEKLKYEKELHQKLFFLNNLLFNKKYIKEEKKKELDKLYEAKNKLIIEYNENFKIDIKQYWIRYDEYDYNYKKRKELLNTEMNKERKSMKKKTTIKSDYLSLQLKNMEYLKNNNITSLNNEMIKKQKQLKNEYIEKFKKINEQKDSLEKEIKIINYELEYYKHVNDELLREYKSYYIEILKKGADIRKDGLLWVVKNLIELQINLEYQHFPKYLTHEQIDFLKKMAYIILEENELKIIISVLKKRQSDERMNDNIKRMNLVDELMNDGKDESNKLNENNDIRNQINQKFSKIYKNNQNALKFTFDKNKENLKIKNILIQIKKGLYSIGDNLNRNNNNFIKENKNNILNAFIGKTKDKDLFSLILSIRNRLVCLNDIKKKLIEKEKENYLDSIKFISNNAYIDKMPVKELIKKSLFGFTQFDT